jgi:hypothetical protein
LNNGDLSVGSIPSVSGTSSILGVACPTSSDCIAVGFETQPAESVIVPFSVSATGITLGTTQSVSGANSLGSIACMTSTTCLTVGSNGTQGEVALISGPTFTSTTSTTFMVGQSGSFTVVATGYPAPKISANGALPNGVMLVDNHDGTATLSGIAQSGTGAEYPLTITASNGIGTDAAQSFTLSVDEAPLIISPSNATFPVGKASTFTVTTSGYPKPSLAETGPLPIGTNFVDNHDGTASITGTPTKETDGTYLLAIMASNGIRADFSQSFTLVVTGQPPAYEVHLPFVANGCTSCVP